MTHVELDNYLSYMFQADGFKNNKFENLKTRRFLENSKKPMNGWKRDSDNSEWFKDIDIKISDEDLNTDAREILIAIIREVEKRDYALKVVNEVKDLDDIQIYNHNRNMILKW